MKTYTPIKSNKLQLVWGLSDVTSFLLPPHQPDYPMFCSIVGGQGWGVRYLLQNDKPKSKGLNTLIL